MKPFAVIDLETDPFKYGRVPKPFAAGYYDGKTLQTFWVDRCVLSLLDFLILQKRDIIIYAHNGGKFDFHFFLEFLPLSDCQTFCIGSRIVKLTVRYKGFSLEFRDSFCLIPAPLKSWGKDTIDYELLEKEKRNSARLKILAYLKTDLRQLYNMLQEFFTRYGRELTLASTAFKILHKEFKLPTVRVSSYTDAKFRFFYFAGRVSYWSIGRHRGNYDILDINSAFPYAMTFPHWYSEGYSVLSRIPKKNPENCFYEIVADSAEALPVRQKDKSVGFPNCVRQTITCTGWELFAGIETGTLKNVVIKKCYKPEKCYDFGPFVRKFYDLKKNAKTEADRFFAKIMLNAAYGKYALNPEKFRDVAITKYREKPEGNGWRVSYDDLERGITLWQRKSGDAENARPVPLYNVATAASITGFVRAMLWRAIKQCRKVLYCDTDSVIAENTEKLPKGENLGEWKTVITADVVWIGGKKLYVAHDKNYPWFNSRQSCDAAFPGACVFVDSLGYTPRIAFKTAAKGVRFSVEDLIAVCEGQEKSMKFDAPSFSVFGGTKFVERTIKRATA